MTFRDSKLKLIIGVLAGVAAIGLFVYTHYRLQSWEQTTATVVDIVRERAGRDIKKYFVCEYTGEAGEKFRGKTLMQFGFSGLDVGEQTAIYYNPKSPAQIMIDSFWQKYLKSTVLLVVSLLVIIPWLNRKKNNKGASDGEHF